MPLLRCPLFHMSLIRSLSWYSLQARRDLFWTYLMSIISFGNRISGVKLEFYYYMLIRAITFSVSISCLDITILIFFRITKLFWVSPGFFLVPFGLSSAPYVFTKCLRPLVKFWRSNAIKIVVLLDDGCGKGDSLPMAKENSLFVQSSLNSAGFVANSAKSLWNPTQVLVWLGLN